MCFGTVRTVHHRVSQHATTAGFLAVIRLGCASDLSLICGWFGADLGDQYSMFGLQVSVSCVQKPFCGPYTGWGGGALRDCLYVTGVGGRLVSAEVGKGTCACTCPTLPSSCSGWVRGCWTPSPTIRVLATHLRWFLGLLPLGCVRTGAGGTMRLYLPWFLPCPANSIRGAWPWLWIASAVRVTAFGGMIREPRCKGRCHGYRPRLSALQAFRFGARPHLGRSLAPWWLCPSIRFGALRRGAERLRGSHVLPLGLVWL